MFFSPKQGLGLGLELELNTGASAAETASVALILPPPLDVVPVGQPEWPVLRC